MYTEEQEKDLLQQTGALLKTEIRGDESEALAIAGNLHRVISYHDYKYYIQNQAVISDFEYDRLYKLLKEIEMKFPKLVTPASPTQRVPAGLAKDFPPVEHLVPMLSLDNSYDENDLRDFDKRIRNLCGEEEVEYCVEPKFDGASISLVYENDSYTRGASRGDGAVGEDITRNLRVLRTLPLKAAFSREGIYKIEIRGEVLIRKDIFQEMNRQRVEEGSAPFANPRNSAAGALRLLDPREVAKRGLEAFLYQVSFAEDKEGRDLLFTGLKSHIEAIALLQQNGFRTPGNTLKICKGIREVVEYCHEWEEKRDSYPYEIDGMVIKVNSFQLQEKLGRTSHHPRWAMAFKFKAKQAVSTLLGVEFQVGRVGTITPVAKIQTVDIGGVKVKSASMFNEDFIREKDIRLGDKVVVERAGDVIPYIVRPLAESRSGNEIQVQFPKLCPSCKSELLKPEDEVALRCININCPAQVVERLKLVVSKDAMDIGGFGAANVLKFYELGFIHSIPDIFRLDYNKIAALSGFREKSVNNLRDAIEKSKHQPLHRLLFGLGIRHVGQTTARMLVGQVHCLDEFKSWSETQLMELQDIGPKVAASIHEFFSNEENLGMIKELRELGVKVCHEKEIGERDGVLSGLTFLFTGSLEKFSRSQAHELVEEHGGTISSGISARVNYLVAGVDAGSKLEKARKLGTVKIISEDEFLKMIG